MLKEITHTLNKYYPGIEPYPGIQEKELNNATGIYINPDDNNWQFLTEDLSDPKLQGSIETLLITNLQINGKSLPVYEY